MKKTSCFLFFLFLCCNFSFSQDFDETKTKVLFEKLNKQSTTPFNYLILNDFLKELKIEEIKSGKEIEKEVIFENFACECKDKLKISYNQETKIFILSVYEKSFVKDLDWCPEHSYLGFFKIKNNKIVSVEFKLIAG